jgi:membrane-bound inhibitor of C-type lysozyme
MKKLILAFVVLVIFLLLIGFLPYHSLAPTVVSQPINIVQYSCDGGKSITAQYYEGTTTPPSAPAEPPIPGGSVALTFENGNNMKLHQTISADGVRYANADESFVFWSKGQGAIVLENGAEKSYTNCISGQ